MMSDINTAEYVPAPSVYGDIFGVFILIMCIAFAWQAINAINLYAPLRTDGEVVQGHWTASYVDPFTEEEIAAYSFVVEDKTYRNKQPNWTTANQYDQGEPVDIVYLVSDPTVSRVAGTEGYSIRSVVELIISVVTGIFAIQFLFAYHLKHPAWVYILWASITGRGNLSQQDSSATNE